MSTMSIARSGFAQTEAALFNQIAMFSVSGLATTMVLIIQCGLRVTNPWF